MTKSRDVADMVLFRSFSSALSFFHYLAHRIWLTAALEPILLAL